MLAPLKLLNEPLFIYLDMYGNMMFYEESYNTLYSCGKNDLVKCTSDHSNLQITNSNNIKENSDLIDILSELSEPSYNT